MKALRLMNTWFPIPALAIFWIVERRLKTRAQDDHDTILHRMSKAADEMSHWAEYDYVIVNREIEQAFADVKAILFAERLKRARQPGLYDFVRGLQAKL